ncbi:hypothetical protein AK830_g9898 [Neonectria ditissima]|uniref:Uncharacterized protein n=1 Tax=Neonectria ditissima TaxID=78410 RepID=A0A0P7B7Z9_9HYPO|nr:hypothetical protein AK830_g9898 [Neonectria ditissima]
MNHERRKQDLHFGIEPFVKTLFGVKDAKKKGEEERRARHKAWAALDRKRARRILGQPRHKSSKKPKPPGPAGEAEDEPDDGPEDEPGDEAPEAPGGDAESDEPEPENEAK